MKSLGERVASELTAAESAMNTKLAELKKAHALVKGAIGKVSRQDWPFSDVRKLVGNLSVHASGAARDEVQRLQEQLQRHLKEAAPTYERAFIDDLVAEAARSQLTAGTTSGTTFLGPLRLALDFARETATLSYSDQPIGSPMALDAKKLVESVAEFTESLLKIPTDIPKLANDFEEAIRVGLTRSRKPTEGRELRYPLPELHREMTLLRQDRSRAITSGSFQEYPFATFVVELKTLVQSEHNLSAAKRFRLEPAVIENAKNSKKSVFIPNDLQRGYAGGTYFQALVLVTEARSAS